MIPNYETLSAARVFFEKFGYREILTVDEFDVFIIDNKLAGDPGTSDTKDARYRNFVAERTSARNKLNKGGAYCQDGAFMINVVEPGKQYSVTRWEETSVDIAKDIGNQVADYAKGRREKMKHMARVADKMLERDPENADLLEVSHMLSFMAREGLQLQAKVRGLVNQYNVATDAVEQQFKALTDQRNDVDALMGLTHNDTAEVIGQ